MELKDIKIIDSHAHFLVKGTEISSTRENYITNFGKEKWEIVQRKNAYQQEKWRTAWGFPKPEPTEETVLETAEKWILEMKKQQIEKMIFVTAGDWSTSNQNMERLVSAYPDKIAGYAYHNPFDPKAAEKLEKAITRGRLSGYKILAPDIMGRIDDTELYPVWEVAESHKIPVLIHFGILGGAGGIAKHVNISPMMIHDVARAFPDIPFIIPHLGCGQTGDLLQLAWVCPNIYVDTSGSNQWVRWMPYPLTVKELLKKFRETIGPERIIFGSDSSWFPRGFVKRYFDDQLRDCVELGFTESEIKMIFHDNIASILNQVV